MKKKFNIFVLLVISLFTFSTVDAENTVDYTLTITDNYKFEEKINYIISDYEEVPNGYNYFSSIVKDDIYTDIMYNQKYDKTKRFENGRYYVTLSHTFSEYSFSNSIFLNNCFQNESYDYNMDSYSFSGKGGFNCLRGDGLKITIITNHIVRSSDAIVEGNKYVWIPANSKFSMNIKIAKEFEENNNPDEGATDYVDDEDVYDNYFPEDEKEDEVVDDDSAREVEDEKENKFSFTSILIIVSVIVVSLFIIFIILKIKNNKLNKI